MPRRLIAPAAICLLSLAGPAGAQRLQVRLTEESTHRALAGALVEVIDSTTTVVGRAVLGDDGARTVALPRAGTYRVRLRRIGYEPFVGTPIVVSAGATTPLVSEVPARRVLLPPIVASARARCARDAFSDPAFVGLWEQARTALLSTMVAHERSLAELELRPFRRRLNERLETEVELVGLPRITRATRPYVAVSAEQLSRDGYIRGGKDELEFFAPDEAVLLSEQFIDDHCFTAIRGSGASEGQLGVRFEPAQRRRVADISGTMWLDSASAALRYVDFWYVLGTLPPRAQGEDRTGGQLIFDRTPGGVWIVSAWRLRMPRFDPARRVTVRSVPDWYEETGGVVTPPRGDTTPPSPVAIGYRDLVAPARLSGTVYDSLGWRPLAGARVWAAPVETPELTALGLVGAGRLVLEPRAVLTDTAGRYTIGDLPAGLYRVGFEHPVLDSLAVLDTRFDLRLHPGGSVLGDLAIPRLVTLGRGCTDRYGQPDKLTGGLLMGVVRGAGDDRPLMNALVRATWTELVVSATGALPVPTTVEARTDSLGVYRICGVPDSTLVTLRAAGPHSLSGEVDAQLGLPARLSRRDFRLAEIAEGESALSMSSVIGTVSDSAGHAIANATIAIEGTSITARSDAAGGFRLGGIAPGTQTVEVRRLGLETVRRTIDLFPGATTSIRLMLVRAQLLDAVLVSAVRASTTTSVRDAIRRHRAGTGILLTGEAISHAPTLQSMVQGLPGVTTQTGMSGAGRWFAVMRRGGGGTIGGGGPDCTARVFLDGREIDYELLTSYAPADIAAVEVFVRAATAPMFASGRSLTGDNACGVLAFWTGR